MTRTSRLGKRLNETKLSIFLMDPRSVIRYSEYVRNVSDEIRKRSGNVCKRATSTKL